MSKRMFATWAAAAALLLAGSQARAVIIEIGSATTSPDSTVGIDVSLVPEDAVVAGTQNDTTFSGGIGAEVRIAAKTNGRPDCAVNPVIMKGGTSFAFQPPGCTGDACTAVRALVLALDNVCPICGVATTDCPDVVACPVVMYTCQVAVSAAASGDFPLTNSNEGSSDPDGVALPTTGTDGTVSVTAPPGGTTIEIGSASGPAGSSVTVDVSLHAEDAIAGTQNDITFDPDAAVAPKANGRPDCTVNPDINKGGTSFAFQPAGCTVGTTCTGIRALVLALDNVCPICARESTTDCPDLPTCPVVMYTCTIAIAGDAEDGEEYPLACSNAGASDPAGVAVDAACTDGTITVEGPEGPTNTPTTTPTVTPTTPTGGTPTNTPTVRPPATNTPGGGVIIIRNDDDACAIVSPATTSSGWIVLLPAAVLLWLRRRSR